ncbi:CoA pyrophosphatase [Lewinella sp. 4G2]|uniref:NUDIX hydrolase n=1 Tax=Lewinella sp. 4G2 TaxID=1803372 RepID=UPI0007B4D5C4|nr:CoA pyrophosphatase [Lewinella sp. 4G2]OAV43491.1 hypothetical protein A3850_002820 [Lewinella sp. 4G2]
MLDQIRLALSTSPLPGRQAQARLAPPGRGDFPEPPKNARVASVLALFHHFEGELNLLFIQRTSPPNDRHAGQISFPGGSVDPGDTDAKDTALREAEEEIGIDRNDVEILGALTPLYIPVSNFIVDPFVGYWGAAAGAEFKLQASEVERTLWVPFQQLLDPTNRKVGDRKTSRGLLIKDVPYYAVNGEEIWGATAMMTAELVALITG